MLTNCHTLILKRLVGKGFGASCDEEDIYLYNIAPDNLPLAEGFDTRETHRFAPAPGLLARHPKLLWVKCHLIVDNFCHYGTMAKPVGTFSPTEKGGYTYRRGADLIPEVKRYCASVGAPVDGQTAHYLAHILVEIAMDYAIYLDDRSVPCILRDAQEGISAEQAREYTESLSALYECTPAMIKGATDAAKKFYGEFHDIDQLFLSGRTKIILRKLNLSYGSKNVERTEALILQAAEKVSDYMKFIEDSGKLLADARDWGGEDPLESGPA